LRRLGATLRVLTLTVHGRLVTTIVGIKKAAKLAFEVVFAAKYIM